MAIVLDGSNLTIESLVRIARFGEKVELAAGGPGAHQGVPRDAGREARGP